ncbi:unnamed protein product [Clonostachys byssicola]|uniref:Uncharacterized protein n=1 Tax=Clonostachys byssicola TaxID=160290 RepID=A0A9N9XVA1_9HYPO|nr:unnamed protein product [Clonostachys byssicola]
MAEEITVPGDLICLIDSGDGFGPPLSKRPGGSMLLNGAGDDTGGADVEELPNPQTLEIDMESFSQSVILHSSAVEASRAFIAGLKTFNPFPGDQEGLVGFA